MNKVLSILLTIATVICATETQFVIVDVDNASIYKKQTWSENETPVATVKKGDKLEVTKTKDKTYRVKTEKSLSGWVLKSSVIPAKKSTLDGFKAETVQSSNSKPTPGYVDGIDDTEPTAAIIPDRSFKDNLKNNVDKESVTK